jgi:hypothetical protein
MNLFTKIHYEFDKDNLDMSTYNQIVFRVESLITECAAMWSVVIVHSLECIFSYNN